MNVISLEEHRTRRPFVPATPAAALLPDAALHEILRRAVVDTGMAARRPSRAVKYRELAFARLEALEAVMGAEGLARHLHRMLESGAHDILALARAARSWDGPTAG